MANKAECPPDVVEAIAEMAGYLHTQERDNYADYIVNAGPGSDHIYSAVLQVLDWLGTIPSCADFAHGLLASAPGAHRTVAGQNIHE